MPRLKQSRNKLHGGLNVSRSRGVQTSSNTSLRTHAGASANPNARKYAQRETSYIHILCAGAFLNSKSEPCSKNGIANHRDAARGTRSGTAFPVGVNLLKHSQMSAIVPPGKQCPEKDLTVIACHSSNRGKRRKTGRQK